MLEEYLKVNACGYFVNVTDHIVHRPNPKDNLLVWVMGGRGFGQMGDYRESTAAEDLLMFPAGTAQAYGCARNHWWDILWVHFEGRLAGMFMDQFQAYGRLRATLRFNAPLQRQFMELVMAHASAGPGIELHVHTSLVGLLGRIVYQLHLGSIAAQDAQPLDVDRLQTYIRDHLTEPLTLEQLAKHAHLSPTHFSRVFKQLFSVSPMRYVIKQRMSQACTLLAETSMKLYRVGLAVGYDDPYYFSRIFKRVTGLSPTEYRRQIIDNNKTSII